MIHRDNRRGYEASSALNQIIHREGPRQLTIGDVDTYCIRINGNGPATVRLIEHKQPEQRIKMMQAIALESFGRALQCAAAQQLVADNSGVFVLRGQLTASSGGRRKVDFAGPQTLQTIDGKPVREFAKRGELWDWLCCGQPHSLRNEAF